MASLVFPFFIVSNERLVFISFILLTVNYLYGGWILKFFYSRIILIINIIFYIVQNKVLLLHHLSLFINTTKILFCWIVVVSNLLYALLFVNAAE